MKVKQAMHTGAQRVEPGTPLTILAQLMREHSIGAIPISEDDRLVGMVTDRDIVCRGLAAGLDLNRATARDVMSKGIFCFTETEEAAEGGCTTWENKERRHPVVK